jgi:hypothetical protein
MTTHIRLATLASALVGAALAADAVSAATNLNSSKSQPPSAASNGPSVGQPDLGERRTAIGSLSADASAVLAAIQSDPKLLDQLARNPAGGAALLRAHGATRSERITVSASGGAAARKTTVTITITIDDVTITIKF